MKSLLLICLMFIAISSQAQVAINIDGSNPDISAMLDVKSTTKGLLAPRMTLAQRNAIVAPATGLLVFQTNNTPGYYYNSGTPAVPAWVIVGSNAGQWQANGNDIYYNLGKVGIGTSTPIKKLDVGGPVGVNDYSPFIYLNGTLTTGNRGLSFETEGNSKAWLYYNTNSNSMIFNAFDGVGLRPDLTIKNTGNVGIGGLDAAARLHVFENSPGYTAAFGTPVSGFTAGTNVAIGDDDETSLMYIGQSSSRKGFLIWHYDATPADAYFSIGTYAGSNPLILQTASSGNVGIGTTTPVTRLDVRIDNNGYSQLGYSAKHPNYFYHNELPANGDGQTALYVYRTRDAPNDGTGYNYLSSNTAIKGFSSWGDQYSFATSGYNWNDSPRSGGIIGAQQGGSYWGSLGYNSSSSTNYGGYFTSSKTGSGKSIQTSTGIGLGAWGDLMGADIHGKVYGLYAEGGNYAMFANGDVYKNKLDIHLQESSTGTNTVLYTNVSTEVTIQTSGVATLSNGKVSIAFDPSFAAVASSESPVIVTVTPIGNSNGVYLAEVSGKGFTVVENNAGKSSITVNYIAIAKRVGYEHPVLSNEVIDAAYTNNISRGLHNDADTETNGDGLYYENGKLTVGIHPSSLPDPNRPGEETLIPKPGVPVLDAVNSNSPSGRGEFIDKEIKQVVPVNGNKDGNASSKISPEVKPDKAK